MNQTTKLHTPWGYAEHSTELIAGVSAVSTASHGGMRISQARRQAMQALSVPDNWVREWYEEDCEVAAVILAFHNEFDPPVVAEAYAIVQKIDEANWRWGELLAWASANKTITDRIELDYSHSGQCPLCTQDFKVWCKESEYLSWKSGVLIQNAMPKLSVPDRERFQTGICNECWKTLSDGFGDED